MHIVADQCPSQRDGMRGKRALSTQLRLKRADMETCVSLPLQKVIFDRCAFASHDLGDRVSEISAATRSHITLDNAGLAPLIQDDQISRVGDDGSILTRGNED